ncbi:UbiX family flavin prenyltransferase [Sporomusa sp. KB1]|jgi:4-hydroxy-3-polyprenylbenzoate decarboxylase|uniref:UbiX family flavin prenyltransferase n=1 Tax=Sporomusa sp. KB1 TaxID=943346 RepID=UPI0011AB1490|nr:UbiX family flavin prenyltransferase [Sporomusa sp. KB1]TWH52046.1 4-hydroxy-3-polyprenylbenzoate decarboxylase [Sporomusa sp. KB1]
MKIILGVSGASGIMYAVKLLEVLNTLNAEVHLVVSEWAARNLAYETNYSLEQLNSLAAYCYDNKEMDACISSGSFHTGGMIVAPCSMKTLAAIAHGYSDSLIVRAADVTLKEKRKLIVMPRETPLSVIHLNNMLLVAQAGATVMPPMPAFYNKPATVEDIINHTVGRMVDHMEIKSGLVKEWGSLI